MKLPKWLKTSKNGPYNYSVKNEVIKEIPPRPRKNAANYLIDIGHATPLLDALEYKNSYAATPNLDAQEFGTNSQPPTPIVYEHSIGEQMKKYKANDKYSSPYPHEKTPDGGPKIDRKGYGLEGFKGTKPEKTDKQHWSKMNIQPPTTNWGNTWPTEVGDHYYALAKEYGYTKEKGLIESMKTDTITASGTNSAYDTAMYFTHLDAQTTSKADWYLPTITVSKNPITYTLPSTTWTTTKPEGTASKLTGDLTFQINTTGPWEDNPNNYYLKKDVFDNTFHTYIQTEEGLYIDGVLQEARKPPAAEKLTPSVINKPEEVPMYDQLAWG